MPPLSHGAVAIDKPPNASRFHLGRLHLSDGWHSSRSCVDQLPKAAQTCLICHDKSASRNPRPDLSGASGENHMAVMMPAPDRAVLDRREKIVADLRAIVPGEGVIDSAAEMIPYESDGLMAYRQPPMVVVLPDTSEQVSQVFLHRGP